MKKNLLFLLVLIAGAFTSLEARGGRGGGRGRGGFHGGGRGHGHYHGGGRGHYRNWNRWGGRGYYGRGWYPGWGWGGFATGLALGAAARNNYCGYDSWGNYVCSYY